MTKNRNYKSVLLGLGLDNEDGHVRVTKDENFRLFGGSRQTHEMMQEKAIKFNEQLDRRRKDLDNISEQEFSDIAKEVGLKTKEK